MKIFGAAGFSSRIRAYVSSAQTIAKNIWVKVEFDTESYDELGEYNNTTLFRFIATVAGYYHFSAFVGITAIEDGKVAYLVIKKNGSYLSAVTQRIGFAGETYNSISGEIYLAATDYLEVFVLHNGVNNEVTDHTYGDPYFCVNRFA